MYQIFNKIKIEYPKTFALNDGLTAIAVLFLSFGACCYESLLPWHKFFSFLAMDIQLLDFCI